jgi:leucyl-tRNA synthetase
VDQTVLAEEQVDEHGRSWRSGAVVEKKLLKQWFVKTTRFAADLYESLSDAQMEAGWRDVVLMQRHWIGQPDGVRVEFSVSREDRERFPEKDAVITSWTSK